MQTNPRRAFWPDRRETIAFGPPPRRKTSPCTGRVCVLDPRFSARVRRGGEKTKKRGCRSTETSVSPTDGFVVHGKINNAKTGSPPRPPRTKTSRRVSLGVSVVSSSAQTCYNRIQTVRRVLVGFPRSRRIRDTHSAGSADGQTTVDVISAFDFLFPCARFKTMTGYSVCMAYNRFLLFSFVVFIFFLSLTISSIENHRFLCVFAVYRFSPLFDFETINTSRTLLVRW